MYAFAQSGLLVFIFLEMSVAAEEINEQESSLF